MLQVPDEQHCGEEEAIQAGASEQLDRCLGLSAAEKLSLAAGDRASRPDELARPHQLHHHQLPHQHLHQQPQGGPIGVLRGVPEPGEAFPSYTHRTAFPQLRVLKGIGLRDFMEM